MKRLMLPLMAALCAACQQAPQATDFSVSLEPSRVVLPLIGNQTVQLRLSSTGGLPNVPQVRLEQADGSPLPQGLFASLDNNGNWRLTTNNTLEPKTYSLRVVATWGQTVRRTNLEVQVVNPDFGLSLDKPRLSLEQGQGGQAGQQMELRLSPQEGFGRSLRDLEVDILRADGSPLPSGLSVNRFPTDDPNRLRLSWQAFTNAPVGSFMVRVEVRSLTRTRSLEFPLEVLPLAEFNLSSGTNTFVTQQGGSVEVPIQISRGAGFTRPLNFQLQAFNRDARLVSGITGVFNPNPADANQTTLRLQADDTVPECFFGCFYTVRVEGASGDVRRTLEFFLRVEPRYDFGLNPDPNTEIAFDQLEVGFVNILISRSATFRDPITLSITLLDGRPLPAGLTATFNENPPTGNGTGVRLEATRAVPAGTYEVQVRGTAGNLTRTLNLRVQVRLAADFTLEPGQSSLSAVRGRSYELAVTARRNASQQNYDLQPVLEREDGSSLPDGLSFYFVYDPSLSYGYIRDSGRLVVRVGAGVAPGSYRLRLRATINIRNPLERTAPLTLTVGDGSSAGTLVSVSVPQRYSPWISWAAFQDGAGAWQGLDSGAVDSFRFRVTDPAGRYGVAVWCSGPGSIAVYQLTLAETANPRLACRPRTYGQLSSQPIGQITAVEPTPHIRPVVAWSGSGQLYIAEVDQLSGGSFAGTPINAVVSSGWMQGRTSYTLPILNNTPGWDPLWSFRSTPSSLGRFTLSRLNTNRSVSSALIYLGDDGVQGLPTAEQSGFQAEMPTATGNWIP